MKPSFLGLRTTIYHVPDLETAKNWYTKIFDIAPYFDEPFYVGFNIGGYELGLLPTEKKEANKTEGVVAYWGVDDAKEMYQRMILLGATAHGEPMDVGEGVTTAEVKDPWGNIIGVIYNPFFKIAD